MKRLTTEQLEAIRKRAEAAFHGPWHLEDRWSGLTSVVGQYPLEIDGAFGVAGCLRKQDAEFIAHAREDIPALLTEVERLQGIDEVYDEDVSELERQNAGLTEQSEMFYEKYRKERRDRARSESKLKAEIERLSEELKDIETALNARNEELGRALQKHEDMTSIALWAARRVHKSHKDFAYDEIERNLGREVERV